MRKKVVLTVTLWSSVITLDFVNGTYNSNGYYCWPHAQQNCAYQPSSSSSVVNSGGGNYQQYSGPSVPSQTQSTNRYWGQSASFTSDNSSGAKGVGEPSGQKP